MAELVDALDSGSSGSDIVEVRVLSSALVKSRAFGSGSFTFWLGHDATQPPAGPVPVGPIPEVPMTERRELYSGRIVKLGLETATLPNGQTVSLEIIRHPGAAAIVPLHADGSVSLIRQHRHAAGGMIWEVPAGVVDPGESPSRCAHRELAEEVQLAADQMSPLGAIFTTPGFTDERIHLFLATGLRPIDSAPEADEYIEVHRLPLPVALQMIADGEITDAKTICALHAAAARASVTRRSG